jgi:hypothetical protein
MLTESMLALAMLAPADTPTEPIDEDLVELFIASGDPAVALACDAYSDVNDATVALVVANNGGPSEVALMVDLVDSYLVLQLEGDTLRLTPEARVSFIGWLHTDCTGGAA